MNKYITVFSLLILSGIFLAFERSSKDTVNVYGWYGIINNEVLKDFEKETGIKVVYDVYDNNDTLEAKLLATNSGYDVVFPSFIPYAARQCAMGAYSKLDYKAIPNLKNIEGKITTKFKQSGGNTDYLVPIFWGTIGISYDAGVIKRLFPKLEKVSYDLIFEPENLQKISRFGVSFPEEYIDIFPQTAVFLHVMDEMSVKSPKKILAYMKHFRSIRQYIKKFSSNTMISDLLSGEVAVAIGPSDNAWRARRSAKNVGKDIKYVLPEGYRVLWIDCVAIPAKAPHKANAHKFLNYLLKPEVAAKITNFSGMLLNVPASKKLCRSDIVDDDQICPSNESVLSEFIMGSPSKSSEDARNDKLATRAWSQIRMNEFDYMEVIK